MNLFVCILICCLTAATRADDDGISDGDGQGDNDEVEATTDLESEDFVVDAGGPENRPELDNFGEKPLPKPEREPFGDLDRSDESEEPEDSGIPQMKWSHAGPIEGMECVQWLETADPDTWNDNYLCFDQYYGVHWNSAGPIPGLECTQILEGSDPHTWNDNYLCAPENDKWRFLWSSAGPIPGKTCTKINEPSDPHTWDDNFLCIDDTPKAARNSAPAPATAEALGLQWSSAGPINGKHCVQMLETADPHTWNDNYICFNRDYGVRWNSAGPIGGMDCTQLLESADPHTWSDNYLCVPNGSPWRFLWNSAGPIAGKSCVQLLETADPHTWSDNYLCVEGHL